MTAQMNSKLPVCCVLCSVFVVFVVFVVSSYDGVVYDDPRTELLRQGFYENNLKYHKANN